MKLEEFFDHDAHTRTHSHRKISARYDLWYALNDFVAGLTFILGSLLFFSDSTQRAATWLFLIGSVLFTVRPAIKVLQQLHLKQNASH